MDKNNLFLNEGRNDCKVKNIFLFANSKKKQQQNRKPNLKIVRTTFHMNEPEEENNLFIVSESAFVSFELEVTIH